MKNLTKKLFVAFLLFTAACGGASEGGTDFASEETVSANVSDTNPLQVIDVPEGSETISTPKSVLLAYTVGFNYSADDSEAFYFGVEAINDFYGFEILTVVPFDQADIQVTRDDLEGGKMGLAYVYDGPMCNVILDHEAVDQWKTVSHELLHCLGFGHSEAWESMMHAHNGDGSFTNQMLPLWEDVLEDNQAESAEAKHMGYHQDEEENSEPTLYVD